MSQRIIQGDSAQVLKQFKDNTIDAVITDPPYGIEFLGKEWDRNTGAIEIWRECFRVLKPGGHLLAFSAARTYHHLATNIEGVGFDIRDQIMWLYASGFPKAQDIGKSIQRRQGVERHEVRDVTDGYNIKNQRSFSENNDVPFERMKPIAVPTSPEAVKWSGWKTALKPAHEPIVMARKPFRGSTIDNVLKHGTGALNIDESRIPFENNKDFQSAAYGQDKSKTFGYINTEQQDTYSKQDITKVEANQQGRYPSNVLGEVEGYQKFFYCPKVNRKERHRGFEQEHIPDPLANYAQGDVKNHPLWDPSIGTNIQRLKHKIMEHNRDVGPNLDHIPSNPSGMYEQDEQGKMGDRYEARVEDTRAVGNNHPTVKPVALMRYLVRLVTPAGAHVIDPFSGSGSTGMACRELGRSFTGIDLDPNYCEIAAKRIDASKEDKSETLFE